MEIVKTVTRKEINMQPEVRKGLSRLALEDNQTLKVFIENQLIWMADRGVSYIDMWHQCEAMTAQLKDLSK